MIKKVLNVRQEVVYQNEALGESYRRVVGGLAWPSLPEPGYLVVLGEDWLRNDGLKAHGLRVLAERSGTTVQELYQGCLELRKLCQVETWLTEMKRRQEVGLFLRQNEELKLHPGYGWPGGMVREIYLSAAPYAQDHPALGLYSQLILELVKTGRKVLRFGEQSQLGSYLMARTAEEMREPAARYPQLAALGYAAAEMVLREPWDPRILEQKAVANWDRFQWLGAGR